MSKPKIFYIVDEINPFLQVTSLALLAKELVRSMVLKNYEVRIVMPRFGLINERTNRIHGVSRLSGINIDIEGHHISLVVKVASIKEAKVQVYFMDNEDLFYKKGTFYNRDGQFYKDSDTRIAFISKSALAMLEHLGWSPNIIHCIGWPWGLVPMYIKKTHAYNPLLRNAKIVYTYGSHYFTDKLCPSIISKAEANDITTEDLKDLKNGDFEGFCHLAKQYADVTTYSFDEPNNPATEIVQKLGATYIPADGEFVNEYDKLYKSLLS